MLFKIGMMLVHHSSWWAPTVAVTLLVCLIFGAAYMSRDNASNKVEQMEHIYTSTLGRVIGLTLVELLTIAVVWLIGEIYIISQMVTVLIVFAFAYLCILAAGWYINKKNKDQKTVGVMKAYASSKARRKGLEKAVEDEYTDSDPQEVAGWGLMVSVAASNALDVVLAEVVDQFDAAREHPLLTKVLLAVAFAVVLACFWHHHMQPVSLMSVDDHEAEMREEGDGEPTGAERETLIPSAE